MPPFVSYAGMLTSTWSIEKLNSALCFFGVEFTFSNEGLNINRSIEKVNSTLQKKIPQIL